MKKSTKKIKVPFYAHLLTQQEKQQVSAGGDPTSPRNDLIMTNPTADLQSMKWPSDDDEGGPLLKS